MLIGSLSTLEPQTNLAGPQHNVPWFYNWVFHSRFQKKKIISSSSSGYGLEPRLCLGDLFLCGCASHIIFLTYLANVTCHPFLAAQGLSLRKEDKGPGPTLPTVASLGQAITIKLALNGVVKRNFISMMHFIYEQI